MYVVGLAGKAGVGKSTVAKELHDMALMGEFEVHIVPFAEALKDIAYRMGWDGQKDEKGRRLLQLLGTECGRECIGPDIWVRHWKERVHSIQRAMGPTEELLVIADDVRFANEVEAIKNMLGQSYLISSNERGGQIATANHASESIPDVEWCHEYINDNPTAPIAIACDILKRRV